MMDNEEDGLHKPSNSGRLKLKKNYKESTGKIHLYDDSNEQGKNGSTSSTPQISCKDDSILDFKSPEKYMLEKNINGNKLLDKSKKKIIRAKIKVTNDKKKPDSSKQFQNKKNIYDIQQPPIESSFFKVENKVDLPQTTADIKTAYVCPLCFKNLKDESLQAIHMKSCAIKNNVSTKKLLDAVELQERQAAERKSLGLLSAPILQDKKKPVSRKATLHDDPDLQLALALSKSLYEKEEMEILNEAEVITISSSPSLPDIKKECFQRTTLQSFGFTSDRSISPINNYPTNKMKKRKLIKPTILQRRTTAERERILTEKIAEILMGYKDFTQNVQTEDDQSIKIKERVDIKSQLLQQLRKTENTLWDRTRLTPSQNIFYVKQLLPQIAPLLKKEYELNEEQNVIKLTDQSDKELTKELQEIKEVQTVDVTDSNEELTIALNAVKTCCKWRKFLDTLAMDWRNILNDSSASDIIVLVKNSRHIWVHKLVFYVRCTNILLDVTSNDTEFSTVKEKICWVDIDYDIALAFLEFIYCGTMNKHSKILDSDASLLAIRSLARKYKVNDLFIYLRQKKFESNLTEAGRKKNTENVIANVGEALNVSKLDELACNARDDMKNTQCVQTNLLQEDINDALQTSENSSVLVDDTCILEDKVAVSIKPLEQINFRNNTPMYRSTSASPDIFDDTPNAIKHDKSVTHSRDHEDSNINILLSLIKQDTDISICSPKLSSKKIDTKYCESDEDSVTRLKNKELDAMEIDLNPDLNSVDLYKNSSVDTPRSSKPKQKTTQIHSSNLARQKGNLTLFIEKIQRENAKLDLDLDSDLDTTTYSNKISHIRHSNPFRIYKWNDSDNEDVESDNLKQSNKTRKKLGKLSIMEQRMQSFADKNPEFYANFSNKCVSDVKQTKSLPTSPERITEFHNEKFVNYSQNVIPTETDVNTSNQGTVAPLSTVHLPYKTNQSLGETIYDLETDMEENEEDISMYSKYTRNHHKNSIAKYRAAIKRNVSDRNLSDESTLSDVPNKDNNINENNAELISSFLTQKDANVIVSSDTEVESISSNINCSVVQYNDNSNHNDYAQLSSKTTEKNKQDIENKENNKSFPIEKISTATTVDFKGKKRDTNNAIESDQTKLNTNNRGMTSDNEDELSMIFTQTRSSLNELNKNKVNNNGEKFSQSPIIVSSSPDLPNMENSSLDREDYDEHVADSRKLKESTGFLLNFEDDIHLANVDIDKYEKHPILEKSKSASILNVTEFNKGNLRRGNNKSNYENTIDNHETTNNVIHCQNLGRNAMFLTQSSTSIRKLKKKSLSEGQININRLHNQKDTFKHTSIQSQCNYNQNIGNIKAMPKIIDKGITPPPDYDGMRTPELHREMNRYGLKVQKRCRAVKLLKHIYNELHPLIPIDEISTEEEVAEVSSDEEGPPAKKPNRDIGSMEKINNSGESDDELPCSQDSNNSVNSIKNTISKEMEFYETESLPALENSSDIREAFTKLINVDKNLHNKILKYEPINIEQLHTTLRAHGFKCKLSNFMNFLDEQCITFYVPEQSVKNRTRRKA